MTSAKRQQHIEALESLKGTYDTAGTDPNVPLRKYATWFDQAKAELVTAQATTQSQQQAERQQHIERLKWLLEVHTFGEDSTAALTAGIAALKREGQMEARSAPDLEPVRRLLDLGKGPYYDSTREAALPAIVGALPALQFLLAEVEKWRKGSRPDALADLRVQAKGNSLAAKQAYINGLETELSISQKENTRLKADNEHLNSFVAAP